MQIGAIKTFTIDGIDYQVHSIDAVKQFHLSRKLAPIMARPIIQLLPLVMRLLSEEELSEEEKKSIPLHLQAAVPDFAEAIAALSEDDANYIIFTCLDYCWRKQDTGWAKVRKAGALMFADLSMLALIRLVVETIKANLGDVFTTGALKASEAAPQQ